MAISLSEVPEELLEHIVSFLDGDTPPSCRDLDEPSSKMIFCEERPLKHLSCTSKQWRRLTSRALFRNLRLDMDMLIVQINELSPRNNTEECDPYNQIDLKNSVVERINNSRTFMRGPMVEHYSLCVFSVMDGSVAPVVVSFIWNIILRSLFDPVRLVVIAPPIRLVTLLGHVLDTRNLWAFDIPHQRIELRKMKGTIENVRHQPSGDFEGHISPLSMGLWSYFEYDEGSSMTMYGQYDYFSKDSPSLVHGSPYPSFLASTWLKKFFYKALFPQTGHFRGVVRYMAHMKLLEELTMQLAPSSGNPSLSDIALVNKGKLSDSWESVEACYEVLVASFILKARGMDWEQPGAGRKFKRFKSFQCRDLHVESIKNQIEQTFNGESKRFGFDTSGAHGWRFDGQDSWNLLGDS